LKGREEITVKESDIRPEELFKRFLDLAKKDSLEFFDAGDFIHVPCPACGADNSGVEFSKHSFEYRICRECHTLYVSPRPDGDALASYYQKAPSNLFWVDFYAQTLEARREKIFAPRAKRIEEIIEKYPAEFQHIYDIGGGHGMMSHELRKIFPDKTYTIIDPSPGLTEMARKKDLFIVEKFMEDVVPDDLKETQTGRAFAMSFEILEHLCEPRTFLQSIRKILKPGDLFVFTALNNQGFDLSVLWEESDSIFPPQHLNIFCVDSIGKLLERGGFTLQEIVTPGKLDVDIVKNKIDKVTDRFISRLVTTLDEGAKEAFQGFLSENLLSSFMMCVTRVV
jgi:SAM-dependent methyltransferase